MKLDLANILATSYDVVAILISIADVTTDVIVIYDFKVAYRMTFFGIALTIMIIAQLAYAIVFVSRFTSAKGIKKHGEQRYIILFIIVLPMSPFLSFFFYWLSIPDNSLIKLLNHYEFEDEWAGGISTDHGSFILDWISRKLLKHMGFIMEAFLEALPQSIIQLIAIVLYQETSIVSILSICISIVSVSTKSMVLSIANDTKIFLFNWVSLVTDFLGIFVCVAWCVPGFFPFFFFSSFLIVLHV